MFRVGVASFSQAAKFMRPQFQKAGQIRFNSTNPNASAKVGEFMKSEGMQRIKDNAEFVLFGTACVIGGGVGIGVIAGTIVAGFEVITAVAE